MSSNIAFWDVISTVYNSVDHGKMEQSSLYKNMGNLLANEMENLNEIMCVCVWLLIRSHWNHEKLKLCQMTSYLTELW